MITDTFSNTLNIRYQSPLKGVEHALDPICDSFIVVAECSVRRPCTGRIHSCSAGDHHHRDADQSLSGADIKFLASSIRKLFKEGE